MNRNLIRIYIDVSEHFQNKAEYIFKTFMETLGVHYFICKKKEISLESFAPDIIYSPKSPPKNWSGVWIVASSDIHNLINYSGGVLISVRNVNVAGVSCISIFPGLVEVEGCSSPSSSCLVVKEDIIASAFYFLSRLEEREINSKDHWGRFPYRLSFFARHGLSPIQLPVNAYLEVLRRMINRILELRGKPMINYPLWKGGKEFAIALTHDVDCMKKWTFRGFVSANYKLVSSLLRRKWPEVAYHGRSLMYFPIYKLRGRDPFFSFQGIIDGEDYFGTASTFYMIMAHNHPFDGAEPRMYKKHLVEVLSMLKRANREVGIHGSTLSSESLEQLLCEKESLESILDQEVVGLRFHNLRFDYHNTFPMVEAAGFLYDSSLGFPEMPGFRTGFSYPYAPYNLEGDRSFRFVELPLVAMDGTFFENRYLHLSVEEAREKIIALLGEIRRWRGAAAILWHNTMFDAHLSRGYDQLYWEIVRWIVEHNGWIASAEQIVRFWSMRCAGNK